MTQKSEDTTEPGTIGLAVKHIVIFWSYFWIVIKENFSLVALVVFIYIIDPKMAYVLTIAMTLVFLGMTLERINNEW